jgi:hypothetical protein
VGATTIGGSAEATAHPFLVDFPVHSDRFQTVRVRFEALGIGHAQINEYTYKDIRDKGRKSLSTYTV